MSCPREGPPRGSEPCPTCASTSHTGVWDGERYQVCPTCGDRGVLPDGYVDKVECEEPYVLCACCGAKNRLKHNVSGGVVLRYDELRMMRLGATGWQATIAATVDAMGMGTFGRVTDEAREWLEIQHADPLGFDRAVALSRSTPHLGLADAYAQIRREGKV